MELADHYLSLFAQKELKRFKLKVGVFLFLIKEEHILMMRRYQMGIDDGLYLVPMGAIEGKETLSTAIVRESLEEANLILQPADLKVCHLMHRFHLMPQGLSFEQLDVFFRVESYQGNIKNLEPDKCDELSFYPLNALPLNTAPFIRHAINCMKSKEIYSQFGW